MAATQMTSGRGPGREPRGNFQAEGPTVPASCALPAPQACPPALGEAQPLALPPPAAPPLRGRPVHDDVDPQDLHGVEGAGQVAHGGQRDEAQGGDAPAGHTHGTVASCAQTRTQPLGPRGRGAGGEASLDSRAQLKSDKVLDVVKNPLAFLHRVPAAQEGLCCSGGLAGSFGQHCGPTPQGSDGVTHHILLGLPPWFSLPAFLETQRVRDDDGRTGAISHLGLVPKP